MFIATHKVTEITTTTAVTGGSIKLNYQGNPRPIDWGICYSTEPEPTISDFINRDTGPWNYYQSTLDGLSPNTRYYVRAYVTNAHGAEYGNELSFVTISNVSNVELVDIKFDAGEFKGSYTVGGAQRVYQTGICWNTTGHPTNLENSQIGGSRTGSFVFSIPNPGDNVMYFARAFASTPSGTFYSQTMVFGAIRDIDNNLYNPVKIGSQVWLRENIRASHFMNGDPITEIGSAPAWRDMVAPAFCQPPVSPTAEYGNLYNGFAVSDPRNVCPAGWHVPIKSDFEKLINSVGGENKGGEALKEAGILSWSYNFSSSATNSSRFAALPAGYRDQTGGYLESSRQARFWSSSIEDIDTNWILQLQSDSNAAILDDNQKAMGLSVRCIKN